MILEQSGIEVERQRLIFSGRVLKDAETVSSYNIKSGNTVHLVKGAAPSTGAAAAGAGGATAAAGGGGANNTTNSNSTSANSQVPSNIAAGQGSGNMLADLTGARYAGLAQLPSASMFGPDGGAGQMNPDNMLSMMEQPQFQEAMREMLANPQMVDNLINSNPQLREMGPQFRQMMQSDYFRNMLTNPQMLRQMFQMNQAMSAMGGGGGAPGAGGGNNFPAPGGEQDSTTNANNNGDNNNNDTRGDASATTQENPFSALFGGAGSGAGAGGAGDQSNPFASLLGGAGAGGGQNPMFDPSILQNILGAQQQQQGAGSFAPPPQEPEDNRPPEERYESQLSQLNELGFYDFDRNVRALRRSGGNVQGAVEALLDGHV